MLTISDFEIVWGIHPKRVRDDEAEEGSREEAHR
jgi:hypothetical protein